MRKQLDMHPYQVAGVDHILKHKRCGLFLDMGLGKTVTSLTAVNILLFQELAISNALVIAPKRVTESVWAQEAKKWEHLKHLKFSIITGTPKQRLAALKVKAHVYLVSRDNIAWLCGLYGGSRLPFGKLIVDESSSFKDHDSQRFKAIKLVLPGFNYVEILTGTPAPNGLINLWPQLYLLDRGKRLGRVVTAYREAYFQYNSYGRRYDLLKGADVEIHEKISDVCMSMAAKDYLDLPERITNHIRLEMPTALQKRYREFEKEKILELIDSNKPVTAANAGVLCNKLLQFSNGFLYDEDHVWHHIHDLKLDALSEIIENAQGQPVLVFWTFKADAERIEKRFRKLKPRRFKKDIDVRDWNKGRIQLGMMHPASGGHGLNLQQGGHIIVWYGQTWSLELEQQANARLDRQGQVSRVVVNKLILEGSMDEDVIAAQETKDRNQNSLLEAVKYRMKQFGF